MAQTYETLTMNDEAPHILVVDDDSRLRDLLRRYLVEQDFRVTTARDVTAARELLAAYDFDLLVLDIMMPGESGLVTARDQRCSGFAAERHGRDRRPHHRPGDRRG